MAWTQNSMMAPDDMTPHEDEVHSEPTDTCADCGSSNLGAFVCADCGCSTLRKGPVERIGTGPYRIQSDADGLD